MRVENEVELLKIIKKHIDPLFNADDFRFWQDMSGSISISKIQMNTKGYTILYYIILDAIMEWEFTDIDSFLTLLDKPPKYIQKFREWFRLNKPKAYDFFEWFANIKDRKLKEIEEKYVKYKKDKWQYTYEIAGKLKFVSLTADKKISLRSLTDTLWAMLDLEVTSPEIRQIFEAYEKTDEELYDDYDKMLKKLGNDVMATKNILLNSCMMAVAWYYNTLKKRIDRGDEIQYYEMREAYKILKTEMNEPTNITEHIQKNMDVNIIFPMSPEDIQKHIQGKVKNMDLSINVADKFKEKMKNTLKIKKDGSTKYNVTT